MRCLSRWITVLLAAALASIPAAGQDALRGLDQGDLALSSLERGTAIVVVWASWSPRCRDIATRVQALKERWGSDARIVTVVFQEDAEDVRAFLDRQGAEGRTMRGDVYLDREGSFAKTHAIASLPGLVIFRDGEVVFRGRLPANPDPVIERGLRSVN